LSLYRDCADFIAGDKLQGQVTEVTLKGNPISRKPLCRLAVIRKLQYLRVLDGTDVSPAEREQSELYALGGVCSRHVSDVSELGDFSIACEQTRCG